MTQVTRQPALISLNQLTYRFAHGETLFDSLNLSFDRRPTAIIGRNGSGKSLLARLLAGELQPSSGSISRHGSLAYVAQDLAITAAHSVAELAGVAPTLQALKRLAAGEASLMDLQQVDERWDLAERMAQMLDGAGLGHLRAEDSAASLSGGQRARVAMIGALLSDADLLLLDEPSNHLDRAGRHWLTQQLQAWRGGLIVISHDRPLLDTVQCIVEISAQGVQRHSGSHAEFLARRQAQDSASQAALEQARSQRSRERKRLQQEHDSIQRHAALSRKQAMTANVAGFERAQLKGAARDIMGKVRHAHQDHKSNLDAQVRTAYERVLVDAPVLLNLPANAVPSGQQVFSLERAQLPWLPPTAPSSYLTCHIKGPARVILSGPNGCGKSTLLKMLAGECVPLSGRCTVSVSCAYLDQSLAQLDPQRSVLEQLLTANGPGDESTLRNHLAHLQLSPRQVTRPSGLLSGGERLKAALTSAVWRPLPAKLLLLDEPTNHLDLASVQAFETALRDFPGALLVASHDQAFIDALEPTHHLLWTPEGWYLHEAAP